MKIEFRNEVISASAGSGKTYQLASRYIRLMYRGVPPERIIAMTFTNKAAGEIFEKIVGRLLKCLSDNDELERLSKENGFEGITRKDMLLILKKLVMSAHMLKISTLDSFFFSIISSFPYELGISGRLALQTTDKEGQDIAMKVLREILFNPDEGEKAKFIEQYKRATFGQEVKSVSSTLYEFIRYGFYSIIEAPDEERWGNPTRILGGEFYGSLLFLDEKELDTLSARLLAIIDVPTTKGILDETAKFIELAKSNRIENPDGDIKTFAERVIAVSMAWDGGSAPLKFKRKDYLVSQEAMSIFAALSRHIVKCHVDNAMLSTRGIYAILSRYEESYTEMIRNTGRLSFSDILYALSSGRTCVSYGDSGFTADFADVKLNIDYRIDSRFDHWLLDEFQDTSSAQWKVISNLIMEVVQDTSGRRSFFYVGDVKQSIYQWRGGDPGLFSRVRELCGERIDLRPLNDSYRSAREIISSVNKVFGSLKAGTVKDLPEPVPAEAASRLMWEEHRSRRDYSGFAALLEINDEEQDPLETMADAIASELRRIEPFKRGLSVGILVRGNKCGAALADALKSRLDHMDVTLEGKRGICDNMVCSAIIAVLRLASHPEDELSLRYLRMTPLSEFLGTSHESFAVGQLARIQKEGFAEYIDGWKRTLLGKGLIRGDDLFHLRRFDQLAAIGEEFDASGGRSCDDFIEAVDKFELSSASVENTIQIMTVHKAKGLEFDIVFLPELRARSISSVSLDSVQIRKNKDHDAEWCLRMPRKKISMQIPALAGFYGELEIEAAYESLCLLYVSMTRAKRALYMFAGKPTSTLYLDDILRQTLSQESVERPGWLDALNVKLLYSEGSSSWYEDEALKPALETAAAETDFKFVFGRIMPETTPSGAEAWKVSASDIFRSNTSLELGSAAHELFSMVEWLDSSDPESIVSGWMKSNPPCSAETRAKAASVFEKSLRSETIRGIFTRPAGANIELWRERRFEIILDGRHVSGAFDRVAIFKDPSGNVLKAEVIDFKTGMPRDIREAAGTYKPQMEIYQAVLAKMLAIPPSSVSKSLLFIEAGERLMV